jgi:SOUL heme-binding protein
MHLFLLQILIGGAAMAVEEPKFIVVSETEDYQVRSYPEILVAETTVAGTFEEVGSDGFKILADYIFGNNKSNVKVAMTAPVTQSPKGEKITMTAPVSQQKMPSGYLIQFTMPANYTFDTLPVPNDSRITIRLLPARKVAVYSYSGFWSESKFEDKLALFYQSLEKNGLKTKGVPIFARFNSPFMLWLFRRNEIWLELEQ